MGVVAIITFSLGKRFMGFENFQILFGLLMATVAKLRFLCREELLVLGSVTHMAGKTFPVGCYHFMGDFKFHPFLCMTAKAKLPALFGEKDRVLRTMGSVAGFALSFLKGF